VEGSNGKAARREFVRQIRSRHPHFWEALLADARVTAAHRRERFTFSSRIGAFLHILRLAWVSDAFLAQAMYRAKARLQQLRVPILPRLLHRMAIIYSQVLIGDPVVVAPGLRILHGPVVIDGVTEIEAGVQISPFVTIGLWGGDIQGPKIESNVFIGTGAKLIGPIRVGAGAKIGANAVVVNDVPPGATVVGVPARPSKERSEPVT
jgi:serine O-acetyltransferase